MPYLDLPPLAPASSRSSSPKLGHEYESLSREPVRFVCSSDVAGDIEGVVQRDALRSHCSSVRNSSPCVTLPISSRSKVIKKCNGRRLEQKRQHTDNLCASRLFRILYNCSTSLFLTQLLKSGNLLHYVYFLCLFLSLLHYVYLRGCTSFLMTLRTLRKLIVQRGWGQSLSWNVKDLLTKKQNSSEVHFQENSPLQSKLTVIPRTSIML